MKQIAIAGLGVVGSGVADLLVNHAAVIEKNAGEEVRLKAVFTRTKKPDSPFASYFDDCTYDDLRYASAYVRIRSRSQR